MNRRRIHPWAWVLVAAGALWATACDDPRTLEGTPCLAESINRYQCGAVDVEEDCDDDGGLFSGRSCDEWKRWTIYRCQDGPGGPTLVKVQDCPMDTTCVELLEGFDVRCAQL